jgi:radical SAM protein with 4Fe4S-binding SPASM domain
MHLLESRRLVGQGLRNAFRKRVTSQIDYRWRDGGSAPPVQLDLKMADACNLRCVMCAQWGESGYNFGRAASEMKDLVPLAVYERLVDEVASVRPWVYIHGGEPFLYPSLVSLLERMKRNGLTVTVVTNGTLVEPHARRLVEIGTDVLMFSVDGPRDVHDRIRGLPGAFDGTVSGIRALGAEKRRRGTARPYVVLNSVVSQANQDSFPAVYELGEELGVNMVLTHYGWFQTADSGRRHTAVMQEGLAVSPWSWKGWVWGVDRIDAAAVAESVKRVQARKWNFWHAFVPELAVADIPRYYSDHAFTFGRSRCVAPWVMAEVMPNGDVVTCRDYPDVVVGNIKDAGILDIWNSRGLRDFRRLLKREGGTLPVCSRCPGMMGG